jgi:predicted unusual protein kinase regulating ubiquinone biosynthesis (AarF/ABC1/UbiB family)
VNDVPRNPVTRAAKLARLPLGLAGRTAVGVGKRIGGRPAEIVAQEIQQRTADQIFRVLGELKGGAMKFGNRRALPGHADQTAGVGAAAARLDRAPGTG